MKCKSLSSRDYSKHIQVPTCTHTAPAHKSTLMGAAGLINCCDLTRKSTFVIRAAVCIGLVPFYPHLFLTSMKRDQRFRLCKTRTFKLWTVVTAVALYKC